MPKRIEMREPTADEKQEIERLTKARNTSAHLIKRAKVLQAIIEEPSLPPSKAGQRVGYTNPESGRGWVTRFNTEGLAGLQDRRRSGKPRTHAEEGRSQLVSLALQKPDRLGYPFALWTLARLQVAFGERHNVHLSDSTIWTWLEEEGLQWRRQESWFHEAEQHDPAFAEKRGSSSSAI